MMNNNSSPDSEITIRDSRAGAPNFEGLVLPTPLRELQRMEAGAASPKRKPTEFTALANRLRKIRLDISPESSPTDSDAAAEFGSSTKPMRLNFDDSEGLDHDKENFDNGVALHDSGEAFHVERTLDGPVGKHPAAVESARGDGNTEDWENRVAKAGDVEASAEAEALGDGRLFNKNILGSKNSLESAEAGIDGDRKSNAEEEEENCAGVFEGVVDDKLDVANVSANTKASPSHNSTPDGQHDFLSTPEAPNADVVEASVQVGHSLDSRTDTNSDKGESACIAVSTPDTSSAQRGDLADAAGGTYPATVQHLPGAKSESPSEGSSESLTDVLSEEPKAQSLKENIATSPDAKDNRLTADDEFVTDDLASGEASGCSMEMLKQHIQTILDGKDRWGWPKRCDAMSAVALALSNSSNEKLKASVCDAMSDLSAIVNDNLDELRPSVITSALSLVNSVLSSNADKDSRFAEEVFPSIMDLACGRSLTAQEAARSLSLALHHHPELRSVLEDADNPDRLCELLAAEAKCGSANDEAEVRASEAIKMVREATLAEVPHVVDKAVVGHSGDASGDPDHAKNGLSSPVSLPIVPSNLARISTPSSGERGVSEKKASKLRHSTSSSMKNKNARGSRMSERTGMLSYSRSESTPRTSVKSGSADKRASTPLMRNMKLGDSVRKLSPTSLQKRRLYTEEDMEDARRSAIRAIMDETTQAHAKEREKLQHRLLTVEKSLRKEQADVAELKSVLEEYELTMQKMVSQGNSKASAYCLSLEKETKKLKVDLLEATEAYEAIKERYESGKQTIKVYEKKEVRNIEQIKDLKRNMSELQKWSNDLKANTEKKLAKAFENVTSYRASYMDKEAHLSKAVSDLERTRDELKKQSSDHAETAAAMARLESLLHAEQDAKSSLEASLSTSKASLARLTSQRDRLQQELSDAQDELRKTTSQLAEKESSDHRAAEALKQIETFNVESQSLKARAYDDMTRIRDLEYEVEAKDRELEEMSAICEEALSQLEKMKLERN